MMSSMVRRLVPGVAFIASVAAAAGYQSDWQGAPTPLLPPSFSGLPAARRDAAALALAKL